MMEIFRLEARKYAPRWGLFVGLIDELIVLGFWITTGHVPVTNQVMITPGDYYQFPTEWSRFWDGLIVSIPIILIAYITFRSAAIRKRWAGSKATDYDSDLPVIWGVIIGLCGLLPTSFAGIRGDLIATPIVMFILAMSCAIGAHYYQVIMTSVLTILVIWAGETLFLGSAAATILAGFIFAYTLAILIGIAVMVTVLLTAIAVLYSIGEYTLFTFLVPRKWGPDELELSVFMANLRHRNKPATGTDIEKAA